MKKIIIAGLLVFSLAVAVFGVSVSVPKANACSLVCTSDGACTCYTSHGH